MRCFLRCQHDFQENGVFLCGAVVVVNSRSSQKDQGVNERDDELCSLGLDFPYSSFRFPYPFRRRARARGNEELEVGDERKLCLLHTFRQIG